MITENNWLTTNILDRFGEKHTQLKCTVTPYKFKQYTFNVACSRAARHIGRKYEKIYLALSGGLDSSHVFKVLMKNHIDVKFTPVIVRIEGNASNRLEVARAAKLCADYNVVPKVIKVSERDCLELYWDKIYRQGMGIYAAPLFMIGEMAKHDGAVVITGEHIINVNRGGTSEMLSSEYDFYLDFIDPNILIPFFLYSLEIVNGTCRYALDNNIRAWDLKSALYGTKEQTVNNRFSSQYDKIVSSISEMHFDKFAYHKYGSFKAFYGYLESWRK